MCRSGTLPEGLTFPPFVFRAGEEEDGDDDDEAEGATGKRAAEDDEVGRAGSPSEPHMSPEGWGVGRVSLGPEGLGSGAGMLCLPAPRVSPGTQPSSIYTLAWLGGCLLLPSGSLGWGALECSWQAWVGTLGGSLRREDFA